MRRISPSRWQIHRDHTTSYQRFCLSPHRLPTSVLHSRVSPHNQDERKRSQFLPKAKKALLTRSSVKTRIAFPPLFCTNVLGITSIASATALYGHPSTPSTVLAFAWRPTLTAISVAPPPGASIGLKTTLRATDIASARLRSISFRMSLEGPRRRIVHALGVSHSVRKVKYLWKDKL